MRLETLLRKTNGLDGIGAEHFRISVQLWAGIFGREIPIKPREIKEVFSKGEDGKAMCDELGDQWLGSLGDELSAVIPSGQPNSGFDEADPGIA